MKKALIAASIAVATLAAAAPASAQVNEENINPWRHCGIGAAIFTDNPTAAAISNIIWDSGTTAVTSATASPNSCSGEEVQVAQFIDQTYDLLAMETAIGEGEHLAALFALKGCEASAGMIESLRGDLATLTADESFSNMDHADKAFNYYSSLNQAAAGQCQTS